jgi:hypothetical protein
MEDHPIFNAFPNAFEISEQDLPNFVQYVTYDIEELNTLKNSNQ